ncbi:alpha/beta hydrolase [Gordonia sp. CPCC 205515]|uniref:alpha/beta fold hydrolase n=1 Tax=Gordonia sp. CPCC 205515 TaxID=3140791 RepID=UPI003AF3C307
MTNATADIVERFVTIDDVRTRTLSVAGTGPTILLLHGFTDSADTFRPVLAELAALGRSAVAVDLPGAGYAPALGRPAIAALDRFVDGFVSQHSEPGGVVLAGNSLGGFIALRAAGRSELPIHAVAGLGPAGLAYHGRLASLTSLLPRLEPILSLADALPVPTAVVQWMARMMFWQRLARRRGSASIAHRYASHYRGLPDIARIRRDLIAFGREDNLLDPAALAAIDVPTLLIWGDRDPLADVGGAPVLLDTVPDSRLVVLDDCGHCPQLEYPAEIAELLAGLPATALAGDTPTPLSKSREK